MIYCTFRQKCYICIVYKPGMMNKFKLLALTLFMFQAVSYSQINLTQGLKLYFPFSGDASDASGNGNVATVYGAALTTDRFGNPNSAYSFDGIDDYISFVEGPGMKPNYPFSISCWLRYISGNNEVNGVFYNDYLNDGSLYYGTMLTMSTGLMVSNVGDGTPVGPAARRSKQSTTPIPVGTWHHYAAVVYGPTNMRIFIDCNEIPGTYTGTGGGLQYSSSNIGMIARANGGLGVGEVYHNADIDEVRFYDRALTDDEIAALYMYPVYPPARLFALPTDNLQIPCGSSVNIDATFTGILTYNWSDGITTPTNTFNAAGSYTISAFDGCLTGYDTVDVTALGNPPVITLTGDTLVCTGQNVLLTAAGANSYTWSPGTGLNTTSGPTVTASINSNTTYTVIGSNGCGTDTATIQLTSVNAVVPNFTTTVDECTGLVTLQNNTVGTSNLVWKWNNSSSSVMPPALGFTSAGEHDISLITNPGTSCADTLTRTITISVGEEELVYLPNSFTPNGDGTNDFFGVYTAQVCLSGELRIFNNWGEEIYYTDKAFTDYWDGIYKNKRVPAGVYAYRLTLNTGKDYFGKVVLVR